MPTAHLRRMENVTTPLGYLDAASIGTRTSRAIGCLLREEEASPDIFVAMARLLPRMLSTRSLKNIRPERVNTPRLIAVNHAARRLCVPESAKDSIEDLAKVLLSVEDDLIRLSKGEGLSKDRLSEIQRFCLGLASSLIDQTPIPASAPDVKRV